MSMDMQTLAADEFGHRAARDAADLPDDPNQPGPDPEGPRLCLRKPRNRKWRYPGEREYAIRYRHPKTGRVTEKRLQLPQSAKRMAEHRLDLFKAKLSAKKIGYIAPRKVPIEAVCTWWIEQYVPDAGAVPAQLNLYRTKRRYLLNVAEHFKGRTLQDFTPAAVTAYINARMAMQVANWRGRPDAPCVSRSTAMSELYQFRRALKLYKDEHQLGWAPLLSLPYVIARRERFLTHEEFQDLLWACDGRIKDVATGQWLTTVGGDGAETFVLRDETTIKRREAMARAIIIGCFVGLRHQILANLVWSHHPSRPCFDVEAGLVHRNGYLEDPTKGKPRNTSAVRPEIIPYLKEWRADDLAAGHDYVIRKLDGNPYYEFNHVFNDVVADAGLGPDVTPHALRHTAVTWMLQDGYPMDVVADMVDMTVANLYKYYSHWCLRSHIEAVQRHIPVRKKYAMAPFDAADMPRRAKLYAPPASPSGNRRHADKSRQRPVRLRPGAVIELRRPPATGTGARSVSASR